MKPSHAGAGHRIVFLDVFRFVMVALALIAFALLLAATYGAMRLWERRLARCEPVERLHSLLTAASARVARS